MPRDLCPRPVSKHGVIMRRPHLKTLFVAVLAVAAGLPLAALGASPRHWAFVTPQRPAVPKVKNAAWVRNPIDAFVLARLERGAIRPSPAADRITLMRRLHLDLTGLPPTAEEVEAYVRDWNEWQRGEGRGARSEQGMADPYERLIVRLLASPHFGERWGRHWLDLARYADSDGYEKDSPRPFAYLYRDWVIDALNRDLPFDQFTVEQLAGDLLWEEMRKRGNEETKATAAGPPISPLPHFPISSPEMATGFHRNTLTNREGGIDPEEDRIKATSDRVNTTGTVWLGLTVACAECHNHKYEPISQREYYQLFAFFNSAKEVDLPLGPAPEPSAASAAAKKTPAPVVPKAMVLQENPTPRETFIHIRGDFLRKGDPVQPGTFGVLPPLRAAARPTRLDLARWLVEPRNPLTARVTVNRVWQHLFGQGLVTTPDDFGTRGAPPSHPELLDWLSTTFVNGGMGEWGNGRNHGPQVPHSPTPPLSHSTPWSMKALIRMIVTSATYRQSSRGRPDLQTRDPKNVLLARQNRFRPEAEIMRDLCLSASGLLNRSVGGPSIRPPLPADIAALGYANSVKWPETTGPERYRRGMYIFYQRTVPYPMLAAFDTPDSNVTCTRRERSNTPLQALTLLNDPVFFEAAQALGRRMAARGASAAERLSYGFRACLSREPTSAELNRLRTLYDEVRALCEARPDEAAKLAGGKPTEGVPVAEVAAYAAVARTLLNLDEFLTRE